MSQTPLYQGGICIRMALNKAWSEEREMGVNLMPSSPSKNKRPLCLLEMMMHFRQYCVALSNLLVTSFA